MAKSSDYATIEVVASSVICRDAKYLLVQEKQPHVYGKWNFPGGHVDKNETLEQAAAREAREETGLEVSIIKQLFVKHRYMDKPALHSYLATISGGELKPQVDEILDVRWFSYSEILDLKTNLRDAEYILSTLAIAQKS